MRKMLFLLALTSCGASPLNFRWNDLENYGTYYPVAFSELSFAENGKGFSASDGTAELWVDTYYSIMFDELPEDFLDEMRVDFEEDLIDAAALQRGHAEPICVSNRTEETDGIRKRKKTVAYGAAFYTVCYSYPADKTKQYEAYEKKIFDTFPVLDRP